MLKRFSLIALFLSLLTMTGCFLAPDRAIALDLIYSGNSTEVTVRYRVPPPPPGKVYVLWLRNPTEGKTAKAGQIPPSSNTRAVRVTADFHVTGAIVSIENSPDVTVMSNDSALRDGFYELTPTPAT